MELIAQNVVMATSLHDFTLDTFVDSGSIKPGWQLMPLMKCAVSHKNLLQNWITLASWLCTSELQLEW